MRTLFFLMTLFLAIGRISNTLSAQESEAAGGDEVSQERYREADANSDGSVSREEFKVYVESKLDGFPAFDRLMAVLDADQDDKISQSEFNQRQKAVQQVNVELEESRKPKEFADIYNERFADNKPVIGDTIEDLIAFDENGNELDFSDLRGKYTVINFGCLT